MDRRVAIGGLESGYSRWLQGYYLEGGDGGEGGVVVALGGDGLGGGGPLCLGYIAYKRGCPKRVSSPFPYLQSLSYGEVGEVLFYFYAGGGVGLATTEDKDLSVAEDFADGGIAIGRYVIHGCGGGTCELRLKGEVFGGSEQIRVSSNAIAPLLEPVAGIGGGGQSNLCAVVISACAGYHALQRVASGGNGMLVDSELGGVGGIALY